MLSICYPVKQVMLKSSPKDNGSVDIDSLLYCRKDDKVFPGVLFPVQTPKAFVLADYTCKGISVQQEFPHRFVLKIHMCFVALCTALLIFRNKAAISDDFFFILSELVYVIFKMTFKYKLAASTHGFYFVSL